MCQIDIVVCLALCKMRSFVFVAGIVKDNALALGLEKYIRVCSLNVPGL